MNHIFRKLKSYLGGVPNARSGAARRSQSFRPQMEALEERLVPAITYNGGRILDHVAVDAVYYGHAWKVDPGLQQEKQQLDAFLKDIVNSPYMDAMSEYYMNNPYYGQLHVGKGTFWASDVVDATFRTDSTGTQVVDDNAIQNMLQQEIQQGHILGGGNALMMVFTPKNVVVVSNGGSASNYLNELGHHASYVDPWDGPVPYAIVPNPIGNPNTYWAATSTDLQKLTSTAAHELEEAVTDPFYGSGWYDSSPPYRGITENGDYTAYYKPITGLAQKGSAGNFGASQQFSLLNGYAVQNVWSVKLGNTVALPQTPADLAGETFKFHASYNSSVIVGTLSIDSENPATGSFTGTYHSYYGWIPVSGQLSNTTLSSGTLSSNISFSGSGSFFFMTFPENVSYQGKVTGNGHAASSNNDFMDGTLTDRIYSYSSLIYSYLSASHATDS